MQTRSQRTLKRAVSFSGVGIHTGKEVSIRFCPASENTGLVFQRVDLPGKPKIPATLPYVKDTSRSTTIGNQDFCIHTVEHVLAALSAFQIDNLVIEVTEAEPPIGDGSSAVFVQLIEEAGIKELQAMQQLHVVDRPVFFSHGQTHLVALPSEHFRISYTLHYPQTKVIRSQFFSVEVNEKSFKEEIATSRTYTLYEEITDLINRGLIRGGSLKNAVVIKDDVVFSTEGLRYPDEMVRHKILDLIGDLMLVGFRFIAHVIAIRSGHATNVAFGKELIQYFSSQGEKIHERSFAF